MNFRVLGLDPQPFNALHGLTDDDLAARNMRRMRVSERHTAPCRISLDDADPGENVVLLNHTHQDADTPYRQQGPIFVRKDVDRCVTLNEVPPALARRTLSLRGFDASHMMIEADLIEGARAPDLVEIFFANPDTAYIHAHYARRGCFAARIERL